MVTREFHAFTMKAPGLLNQLITDVAVTPAYDPENPPNPVPVPKPTKALWDTGASKRVVSTSFVQSLGLAPVGTSQVHHGDGQSTRNTYLVNLFLPNKVCIIGVLATEFPASQNAFNVLIGMDVISLGDLSVTNVNGKTCMSFRTPSCEAIDYVVAANQVKFAGVGRNDPCPCNGGKKFKKCHGATVTQL